jgi:hypothetical protein
LLVLVNGRFEAALFHDTARAAFEIGHALVGLGASHEAAAGGDNALAGNDVTSSRCDYTLRSEHWVNETRTTVRAAIRWQPYLQMRL